MDAIDDILGINDKKKYNNNWKEQQIQERNKAYQIIEKMTNLISRNESKFKDYLDIQSRFSKYSVGNCLLIQFQNPNATIFKDKKTWNDLGVQLVANPKSFQILEPFKSERTGVVYYNPKRVYDISQTNSRNEYNSINYDDKQLLGAFIYNCFAEIKVVNSLENEILGVKYEENENTLYICRGLDSKILFQELSKELGRIEMRDEEESTFKEFKSYCISYMLCKKYGIDVSNYEFRNLIGNFEKQTNAKELREKIDEIRVSFEKINERITECFENKKNRKKDVKKVQER